MGNESLGAPVEYPGDLSRDWCIMTSGREPGRADAGSHLPRKRNDAAVLIFAMRQKSSQKGRYQEKRRQEEPEDGKDHDTNEDAADAAAAAAGRQGTRRELRHRREW